MKRSEVRGAGLAFCEAYPDPPEPPPPGIFRFSIRKKISQSVGGQLLGTVVRFPEAGRTRLVDFFYERKSKKCRGAAEPAGRGKICPVARSHCRLLTSSCCALSALSENIKSLQRGMKRRLNGRVASFRGGLPLIVSDRRTIVHMYSIRTPRYCGLYTKSTRSRVS